jgi:hypothetical protein
MGISPRIFPQTVLESYISKGRPPHFNTQVYTREEEEELHSYL